MIKLMSLISAKNILTVLLICSGFLNPVSGQEDIKAFNSSNYLGDGRWAWKIYIKASNETLNRIGAVVYYLHKSFSPDKIRVPNIGDPKTPFSFSATGWGTFTVKIEIRFKNGQRKYLSHQLVFNEAKPVEYNITAHNSSKLISTDWWSWTVYISSSEDVLNKIKCVEYTLHESFPDPVQLICEKGKNEMAFPYSARGWGTFGIKIKVIFKDGNTQNLSHQLVFKN